MIDKISGEDILRLNQLVITNIEFSPEQSALDWSRDSEMRTLNVRLEISDDPNTKYYVYRISLKCSAADSPTEMFNVDQTVDYILIKYKGDLYLSIRPDSWECTPQIMSDDEL